MKSLFYRPTLRGGLLLLILGALIAVGHRDTRAQGSGPTLTDPALAVRTVIEGLDQPTSLGFFDANDILVLEKNTGKVQRVYDGFLVGTVLDLSVNFGSERGLLGIAVHPDFAHNGLVYLYWTESTTGMDSSVLDDTPLLGNRVDRFLWDGSNLVFDQNLIRLRALQPAFPAEPTPVAGRGNHDGGVITFGPDGKLYILIGDVGRRGWLQNLPCGPTPVCPGDTVPDDQFGGPEPDNAHLTGVILRLNDDGSTPADNPFFAVGAQLGGEVGANIQKIFAYGIRNSFGMAFDPRRGSLWLQENADDAFTELNLVDPGFNSGWIQIMGPARRIAERKEIEVTMFGGNLQQMRWPPTLIADTPEEALARLFVLPGSRYTNPKLSWKFEIAPAGLGFLNGQGLGAEYDGDLFAGAARTFLAGGYLLRFKLNRTRRRIAVSDERLRDRVADNLDKFDITESESLLFGRDFGVGTDIETGPNGNLFVVSLSNGAIYEIYRP